MLFIIGMIVVFGSIVMGYTMHGGKLYVLWQPSEYIIIGGAAIGAFLIANPPHVLTAAGGGLKVVLAGLPYTKK
ncbi:MAG: motility-associated protein, partial [Pseudomonadota bacterium]